jgi:16S rRNA (guanine527-N7)-methyltransferase
MVMGASLTPSVSRETVTLLNPEFSSILEPTLEGLPDTALAQLWSHWLLVKEWNVRINLTAIEDDSEAAWLHYRDSLAALASLPVGGSIVDMGSGAGFPGIPLAIARPEQTFYLVEPRRKRASFLRVAVSRLGLPNVIIHHGRSTDTPPELCEAVVSRATFSAEEDLRACLRWLSPRGVLIAYRAEDSALLSETLHSVSYSLGAHRRRLDIVTAGNNTAI